jgi:Rad3-related DNA helicase
MFDLLNAPTGLGKSLIAIGLHRVQYDVSRPLARRMLILTSTKALQQQIVRDFPDIVMEIKGKANYHCKRFPPTYDIGCDKGPCNWGVSCSLKEKGCDYFDRVRMARTSPCVVTNYSYWIYNNKQEGRDEPGIGRFDTIVCDEAHDAPEKVADAYTIRFSTKNKLEAELLGRYGWVTGDKDAFMTWAKAAMPSAQQALKDAREAQATGRAHAASNAIRKLKEAMGYVNDELELVVDANRKWGALTIGVTWPYELANTVLFTGAKKVVFMSATVTPKTLTMMGIGGNDFNAHYFPHVIPQDRRYLYHVPCVRVNYRMSAADMKAWATKIDTIVRPRIALGWNGIIHPVSYVRAKYVMEHSALVGFMMTHTKDDTEDAIWRFKRAAGKGKVLVSPSVTTGYDFPDDTCRWQIIGKIAFPDTSDPLTKARCERDPDYAPYTAMQNVIQTCGRPVRGEEDWAENFIIDDNAAWFFPKYRHFAPEWFWGSVKRVEYAPQPMGR